MELFSFIRAPVAKPRHPSDGSGPPTLPPKTIGKWQYSPEYKAIVGEGHSRPPPEFGAPTLVWHLAIWPRQDSDNKSVAENSSHADPFHYDIQNSLFFLEISELLRTLQLRGRAPGKEGDNIKGFTFETPTFLDGDKDDFEAPHIFKVCNPQSLAFTLWWQDSAGMARPNTRQQHPEVEDLRVRVQAQSHVDHVTLSFFIDAGKPWDATPFFSSVDAVGVRRKIIFQEIERAKAICDRQIVNGAVDYERIPEQGISDSDAATLLEAANLFYDTLWEEFLAAFGLRVTDGLLAVDTVGDDGPHGEIFANFRGLVLSVDGLHTALEDERQANIADLRARAGIADSVGRPHVPDSDSSVGIGKFKTFDGPSGEANTVLKAYWPFIRRMMPNADERDFIACGLRDWRALYVTALGSPVETIGRDEESGDHLPPSLPHGKEGLNPIRYLFLTKGEPHRDQIGRLVERINAVGTMRLFALKNWLVIRNANVHVRLLGQHLDGILYHWTRSRHAIDRGRDVNAPANTNEQLAEQHAYARRLNGLIKEVQPHLLDIGAQLDRIGKGGAGRLLYAINRSNYFISEFERMTKTLGVGHIETWTNYNQFVERGLQPTFDFIKSTGERFVSLRGRLQAITDIVQTDALIVEADATRENTEVLTRIANSWLLKQSPLLTGAGLVLIQVVGSLAWAELETPLKAMIHNIMQAMGLG